MSVVSAGVGKTEASRSVKVAVSGEVLQVLERIARSKNVSVSIVAREYLTDGMVAANVLPKWWKRGKMVHKP